jgi:tetratricopeptide (TPR) repeat protein
MGAQNSGDLARALQDAKAQHQAGAVAAAALAYAALRQRAPADPEILYLSAAAEFQLGRAQDATALVERALALRPGHEPALTLAAAAWRAAGAPERALPHAQAAAARRPGKAEAHGLLGQVLLDLKQFGDAAASFRRSLGVKSGDVAALTGLALALFHSGDRGGAERTARECLALDPKAFGAALVLGTILGQSGRFGEAETVLRAAVAAAPASGPAWQLLGNSLHRQGRHDEAEAAYRQALTLIPDDAALLDQLADLLIKRGALAEAEQLLQRANARDPRAAGPLTNLGRIAEMRGDLAGAVRLHEAAIARDPAFPFAYLNRGNARRFLGDFAGAVADCDAALGLDPGLSEARACRGFALLALGRLAEGWADYAARIAGQPEVFAPADATGWDGSALAGKRVVVWTEYGLGDEVLAANLLAEVAGAAAACTLLCEPRMVALIRRSFPAVDVQPRPGPGPAAFDLKFALADAARWLRADFAAFPRHAGYLAADPAAVAAFKAALPAGRNVGIAWRSTSASTGPFKTTPLAAWEAVLRVPGVTFHSLQYGDVDAEIAAARAAFGADIRVDHSVDAVRDVDRFAAQVAALDLVISVSNTTVHIAGALGRPVWTLVPEGQGAHWYWFRDRADSPWYPSMRLYRQPSPGAWAPALDAVAADLRRSAP